LAHPEEWRVVRWSKEPRRTSAGEESWAASLSRLRTAWLRVIDNDDTKPKHQVHTLMEEAQPVYGHWKTAKKIGRSLTVPRL
jgi:hypothetical protein